MNKPEGATAQADSCAESCSEEDARGFGARCPLSETAGLGVDRITLKALLKPEALRRLDGTNYQFCPAADCDVAYFDTESGSFFTKEDLTVRVGLKEREHPIPICYCFGYTLADVQSDIATHGHTNIPAIITAEIKAGHCACEVRNPRGTCCLGNVSAAIKTILETSRRIGLA